MRPSTQHSCRDGWLLALLGAGLLAMQTGCEQRVIRSTGIGTRGISTSTPNAPERSLGDLLLGQNKKSKTSKRTLRVWGSDQPTRRP